MPFFREVPYLSRPACPPAFDLTPDAWIPLDQGERFRATFPKTTRVVAPKIVAADEILARKEVAERGARSEEMNKKERCAYSPATLEENAWENLRMLDGWICFFFNVSLLFCEFLLQGISSSLSIHEQYLLWMSTVTPEHL